MRPKFLTFALVFLAPLGAMAFPITLTFSGTATGTLNAVPFTDAAFTLTSIGNTNNAFDNATDAFLPVSTSTIGINGFPIVTFTDSTEWDDPQGAGDMVFEDSTLGISLFGITDLFAGLETYQFSESLGPLTGGDFIPNIFPNFLNIPTNQGLLTITRTSELTFDAAVDTPEPDMAWLVAGAIVILASAKNRLRRA